jgi:ubiquitin-protein ligase E3 A
LIPNGREVKVNKSNLHEFSILYFQLLTQEIIKSEFEAFSSGFFSVMKREFLQGLTSSELEKIIIGCGDIDFEIIKKNTIYNGYGPNNPIIESFWNFFAELKPQKKKRLIQFITGNDRLPVGGSNSLNLVIMRNGCDTSRLPSSQTCFSTLLLPEYSSPEKMREKLSKAIDMTAGFFLM